MNLKDRLKSFSVADEGIEVGHTGGDDPLGEGVGEPAPRSLAVPPLAIALCTERESEYGEKLYQDLLRILDLSLLASMEAVEARRQITDVCYRLMDQQTCPLSAQSRDRVVKSILDEILGLGPIEPLLHEPTVSDILVNGSKSVYVERFGKLEATPIHFRNDAHLLKIIDRIVSGVGRRIDESSPMVDARLKDGSRVNAIIQPLALDGPVLSIRRFSVDRMEMKDLVALHTLDQSMSDVLKAVVRSRLNVLISGGTGSGKTTMLNALSNFIPREERIVTIEDSAELQMQQEHVVRLETRPPNIEGRGEVTQRDLVRNSLRMRPDRIVVGEVRGEEAFDMLQAMNTGHDGSLTTVHANSARDALARIENMVSMSGFELPVKAVRTQIASAINVILQLERMEDGRRRVVSIQEISGMEGEIITLAEVFKFERQGVDAQGNVMGAYAATGIVPKFLDRIRKRGIDLDMHVFMPTSKIV
ncbi:CpaF family protein [Methylogaea oryzae]|uniref:Flp pilus assembly protein TadA n=1 Tax=Methylogaea oryzae TaxID=1295382 RepID=A0A8D5AG41_9GAMM|nr:CpaF family protein [Methylogaea oryzae]BBL69973.1 Flp pilus assembly protein TadA [Methylogaea oryzae]